MCHGEFLDIGEDRKPIFVSLPNSQRQIMKNMTVKRENSQCGTLCGGRGGGGRGGGGDEGTGQIGDTSAVQFG